MAVCGVCVCVCEADAGGWWVRRVEEFRSAHVACG